MTNNKLSAGVARVDITPPVGFRLQGLVKRVEPSIGIESKLTATALVLADDQIKIAIVDCDLIGLDKSLSDEIRNTVAERIGTIKKNVTVACTHTHTGPSTFRAGLGGPHDIVPRQGEISLLDEYITLLVAKIADVTALADERRCLARSGASSGEASMSINREEMLDDGRIFVGRNPNGMTDHSVDVLRIDEMDGSPIAAIVCYAAHPVVMGLKNRLISADYPGVVRSVVEDTTGATCLFLTGAAGDQATIEFIQDDWSAVKKIGGVIGAEAAKIFFQIETRPYKITRTLTESASSLVVYSKDYNDDTTPSILTSSSRIVTIPLQALPSQEHANDQLTHAQLAVKSLELNDAYIGDTVYARLVERWAKGVTDRVSAGIRQDDLIFDIVGYRLNDFVLLTMPGEPFVEIGLRVKALSTAVKTMFSGYGNGNIAYWPTPETVAQGGMAVGASVKTYNISAPPTIETMDIIVEEFKELLVDLDL